jgi:hypothetical protein
MERCPSWPKERDWKSRVLLKGGTEGSNPSLSAIFISLPADSLLLNVTGLSYIEMFKIPKEVIKAQNGIRGFGQKMATPEI